MSNPNKDVIDVLNDLIEYLKTLQWSGNIRELKNVVERLVIMSDKKITLEDAKMYAK